MNKMSLFDMAFFLAESEDSPKHVAGLMIFKRPESAKPSFVKDLYRDFLTFTDIHAPFNRMVEMSKITKPHWCDSPKVDLEQHVFYRKLPSGKSDREHLYRLISEMHSVMLDRSRPLWEMHVIDGIDEDRFAVYMKLHHAYADGITVSRWAADSVSRSPDATELSPMWGRKHGGYVGRRRHKHPVVQSFKDSVVSTSKRVLGIGRLATMLFLETVHLTKNAIALPYVANAHTPLTGQVTAGRQFSTAGIEMKRVNSICKQTRSTLNHVALTCLDGAMHRWLDDQGVQLDRPLTIVMPVNLRREGDKSAGNKIGFVEVELSAVTDDPYVRLRNVGFSLRNVRTLIDNVAPEAIETYTVLTGLAGLVAEKMKWSDRLPPLGNTLVSNVPGPKEYLYLRGARMEEMHPVSTLPPGNLINITLFSYADHLYFGLIATDKLPHLDRLSTYIEEAFVELEASLHVEHE